MAKATPAHIIYKTASGEEQILDFHTVISEDHQASATVTKYPVQTGLHISNHSIRNNRVVTVEGLISNVRLDAVATSVQRPYGNIDHGPNQGLSTDIGSAQLSGDTDYGVDADAQVFDMLESLIHAGTECKVITNLGVYYPVVFTKFKTKQAAGMVDSMRFVISGEEIVKYDETNYSAPTPLLFETVNGPARDKLAAELASYGVIAGACDELSSTSVTLGRDFVLNSYDSQFNEVDTTYRYIGKDPVTGEYQYEVHVGENALLTTHDSIPEAVNTPCAEEGFEESLVGGIRQIGKCIVSEATDIAVEFAEETIDTAMGKLTASLYGAFYDITSFPNDDTGIGSALTKSGLGCIMRTATGSTKTGQYLPGENLPTTDDIMTGAGEFIGVLEPEPEIMTLAQIRCDCIGDPVEEIGHINPIGNAGNIV